MKAVAAAGGEEEGEEEEEEDSVDGYEIDWVGVTATDIEKMHATSLSSFSTLLPGQRQT
jgi:hypothetical protein